MKKWLLALLFATVLTLAACGGGDDGDTEEPADSTDDAATEETTDDAGETVDSAAGEEVYQTNCAMCHGADLSGGAGPDLTAAGDSYSADEIETIIHEGTGAMQPISMEDDEAAAVAAWILEQ